MRVKGIAIFPVQWLALGVFAGIVFMAAGGAPTHYLVINAVALGIAWGLTSALPIASSARALLLCAVGMIIALALPLLVGPEVGGAERWIGAGPVQVHSGMLVIPALSVLLARLKSAHRLVTVVAASIAIVLQPDTGSAIALLAGVGAVLAAERSLANVATFLIATIAICVTLMRPDTLEPVPFVENVLASAWEGNVVLGAVLTLALAATILMPGFRNADFRPSMAAFVGFAIASLLGTYPTPIIGYGAASIVGFGLAIAAARRPVR